MRVSHFIYWTCNGLSRSYISRRSCRACASDWTERSPVWISAGSPGARWITRKETKVMPSRSGMARRSRRSAYPSMARYCIAARNVTRRVALELLRDVPLVEVVADPVRRRDDPAPARGDDRERVAEEQEDDRLVLGEDLLEPGVGFLPLLLVAGHASLLEQRVHLGVRVRDVIELVRARLRRVPDLVLVRVQADAPAEDGRLEPPLLDVLLEEGRPLDHTDVHLDAELLERRLDDFRDLLALVVALVGQELEHEGLAVPDEQAVGVPLLPAGFREQRASLVHVVREPFHVRVVRPGAGLVRARRLAPEAEQHAVDDLALVDGVGERLPDAPVGEPRVLQVEAEIRVGVRWVLVFVVGLPEGRILRLALELERGEAGRVHALRLQLEEDRRLARDDPVDDAREVRGALEVAGVRDEHDPFPGLPLLEPVRARAHRVRPVLRRLAEATLTHVGLEHVLRQHPDAPALQRFRVRLLVADTQRVRIHRLHRRDGAEV